MPEVAHLAEDGVKNIHVRGEVDSGRSVICKLLVGLPLIIEDIQLYSHIRRMTFPVKTIAVILIHLKFLPCCSPHYFRHSRLARIL